MSTENGSLLEYDTTFYPTMYNFRIPPTQSGSKKTFSLQQPFATLFDNLIAVLWSVYCKQSTIQIGVNQLQWALEFLKCMRMDYGYPDNIEKIVDELEDKLIELYAKIGIMINENKQRELKMDKEENSKDNEQVMTYLPDNYISYNEEDILKKLDSKKLLLDPVTGEAKCLKELNSLGNRKPKHRDVCANDKKSTKNYMIGALKKILHKTTDASAKFGVQEYTTYIIAQQSVPTINKRTESEQCSVKKNVVMYMFGKR